MSIVKRTRKAKGSALLQGSIRMRELEARRAEHLSDISKWLPSVLGVFKRKYTGKRKKAALQALCVECQGFDDVRAGVGDCAAYTCPLWEYRPYQKKGGEEAP